MQSLFNGANRIGKIAIFVWFDEFHDAIAASAQDHNNVFKGSVSIDMGRNPCSRGIIIESHLIQFRAFRIVFPVLFKDKVCEFGESRLFVTNDGGIFIVVLMAKVRLKQ